MLSCEMFAVGCEANLDTCHVLRRNSLSIFFWRIEKGALLFHEWALGITSNI